MRIQTLFMIIILCIFSATTTFAHERDRPVIALALQGGGARGISHAGVIQILEELGIPIDIVVGNSMGAIIGGLYAIGYSGRDISDIILTMDWPTLFTEPVSLMDSSYTERRNRARYAIKIPFSAEGIMLGSGVLDGNHALAHLDRLTIRVTSQTDFDSLPKRFRAVASDIISGEAVILDSGSLSDAIRASMSIPGVFEPHIINGRHLVDGLILDNLPINVARSLGADIIIAVYLEDRKQVTPEQLSRNPVMALERTLEIFTDQNVIRQLPNADIVIPVDITGLSVNDFLKAEEFIARGKQAANSMRTRLESLADPSPQPATPVDPVLMMDSLSIIGGTPADKSHVRTMLDTGNGISTDRKTLETLYHMLVQKNRYSSIRMQQKEHDNHREMIVILTGKEEPGHDIHAGFIHEGTYYQDMATYTSIVAGVTFHGITVPGSFLLLDGGFNGTLFTEAVYGHPLSDRLSVEPFFLWKRKTGSTVYDTDSKAYMETKWIQTGAFLRCNLFAGSQCSVGWSRAWINPDFPVAGTDDEENLEVSLLEAGFGSNRLDSALFPMKGYSLELSYLLSLPKMGSDSFFQILTFSGTSVLLSPDPYSLAFHWYGATDFSFSAEDPNSAPLYLAPSLSSRQLFPGPVPLSRRSGNTALTAGIEVKRKWAFASAFFSLPVFALFSTSAGFTSSDPDDFENPWKSLLYCVTAGIGTRINEGFGISLKGGIMFYAQNDYNPFLAVDIGSTLR